MDRKKEVMLAVGAKNIIKKTGPTIAQSFVSKYRHHGEAIGQAGGEGRVCCGV
jgi:hypothetical protein